MKNDFPLERALLHASALRDIPLRERGRERESARQDLSEPTGCYKHEYAISLFYFRGLSADAECMYVR